MDSKKNSQKDVSYTGWQRWKPTPDEWEKLYEDGSIPEYLNLKENEYLIIESDGEIAITYCYEHGKIRKFTGQAIKIATSEPSENSVNEKTDKTKKTKKYSKGKNVNIVPRNIEQSCAVDLLKDRNKTVKLITGGWGTGKAVPNSAMIPTPNGPMRMGELKVGDCVFSEKGKPTQILGVFPQGKKEVYKLTFSDGRTALCSADHLWQVYVMCHGRMESRVLTVREMLDRGIYRDIRSGANTGTKKYKYYLPVSEPVEYSTKHFEVDPYVVGSFIGNVHVKDLFKEIPEIVCKSHEKRIPEKYLFGDFSQRLALLQGLLDTNGSVSKEKARISYSSTSLELIKDIISLCNSLGLCARLKEDKREKYKEGHHSYSISIQCPNDKKSVLFRLDRKKQRCLDSLKERKGTQRHTLTIRKIEDMEYEEEMTCIYVDNPTHLFLTENYIVTHNTMLMVTAALEALKNGEFDKIIWIRNNVDVKDTKDLGALPGEVIDKLLPYLGPFIDHVGENAVKTMIEKESLVVEPLQSLRGRNFSNAIIMCSEAENLTKGHIQLIIARAAEGSEVWFDADNRQRDKAVFEKSRGIETVIEKFAGQELFGYVHLVKSERSKTAAMADLLDDD